MIFFNVFLFELPYGKIYLCTVSVLIMNSQMTNHIITTDNFEKPAVPENCYGFRFRNGGFSITMR